MAGRPPRLTAEQVLFLREWRASRRENRKAGIPIKRLIVQLGVGRTAIQDAARGATYRWVTP
jgi:hypothetical protein